jgi:hypothetical protein
VGLRVIINPAVLQAMRAMMLTKEQTDLEMAK